jgi:hypothetical protein
MSDSVRIPMVLGLRLLRKDMALLNMRAVFQIAVPVHAFDGTVLIYVRSKPDSPSPGGKGRH